MGNLEFVVRDDEMWSEFLPLVSNAGEFLLHLEDARSFREVQVDHALTLVAKGTGSRFRTRRTGSSVRAERRQLLRDIQRLQRAGAAPDTIQILFPCLLFAEGLETTDFFPTPRKSASETLREATRQ
jgi:hypothetical protein